MQKAVWFLHLSSGQCVSTVSGAGFQFQRLVSFRNLVASVYCQILISKWSHSSFWTSKTAWKMVMTAWILMAGKKPSSCYFLNNNDDSSSGLLSVSTGCLKHHAHYVECLQPPCKASVILTLPTGAISWGQKGDVPSIIQTHIYLVPESCLHSTRSYTCLYKTLTYFPKSSRP